MTPRLPRCLRYTHNTVTPPRPPDPPPPLHEQPGTRVTVGPHALRAAFDAHQADEHHGGPGRDCPTCTRYATALAAARAADA